MNSAEKLLDLIRLERAALERWLHELDQRELVIKQWLENDKGAPTSTTAKNR